MSLPPSGWEIPKEIQPTEEGATVGPDYLTIGASGGPGLHDHCQPPLLLDIGLPAEARDLVVAAPDPAEQVLDGGDRVGHAQVVPDPGADLRGVVEEARGDLSLDPLDLGRAEAARIALVVQGAELIQPLVAEDPEPLADLAGRDSQEVGDLRSGPTVIAPEDRREPLVDPSVRGLSPSLVDVLALLGSQPDRLHPTAPPPSRLQSPGCSTPPLRQL